MALHGAGQPRRAIDTLARVLDRHPYDRDTLSALIAYSHEQGQARQALTYAERLAELDPSNMAVRRLVERLEAQSRR